MIDRRTQVKIAYWYYHLGMTQEEIAHKVHYSRQRVNRIINHLVDDGVVDITINGLENEHIKLENALERHFHLKQVVVADTQPSTLPMLSVLGKRAAEFLEGFITDGKTVGVSWGITLGETVKNIRAVRRMGCTIVQLAGGLNTTSQISKPDEICRILANKLGCEYRILYAPAIMNSSFAREVMAKEEAFREVFELIGHCDIAVVGIGELDENSTIVTQGYLGADEFEALRQDGYIGNICFHHYKADGSFGDNNLSERIMGVDFATLRRIPSVVAIAGGAKKADAVIGALRTGCIDLLITEVELAQAIVNRLGLR